MIVAIQEDYLVLSSPWKVLSESSALCHSSLLPFYYSLRVCSLVVHQIMEMSSEVLRIAEVVSGNEGIRRHEWFYDRPLEFWTLQQNGNRFVMVVWTPSKPAARRRGGSLDSRASPWCSPYRWSSRTQCRSGSWMWKDERWKGLVLMKNSLHVEHFLAGSSSIAL